MKQSQLNYLKKIYSLLQKPCKESLKLSMTDTHHKGMFSLVIAGNEFGKLTRIFVANNKLKPFEVQLHTHRYPIKLTSIKGNIKHHSVKVPTSKSCDSIYLSEFEYKSPINGGAGLKYIGEKEVELNDYHLPIGSTLQMSPDEYHTLSCSKGSIWIVQELGFITDTSKVLGVPFVTNELYNQPKPFQINDNVQLIARELKKIILDYELV